MARKGDRKGAHQCKGGAPKISLAYTYALLNEAPIGYAALSPNERLIVGLKYDDVSEAAENSSLWQNEAFVSRALGHVRIREIHVKGKPMLVLSDFTVHRTTRSRTKTKTRTRTRTKTQSRTSIMSIVTTPVITGGSGSSGGYAAVLVGIAMSCIEITYTLAQPNLVLWAAVSDPGWIHVLVNAGFSAPYIATMTPDGIPIETGLALSKHITYFANNIYLVRDSLFKALDMWKNRGATVCSTTFTLDEQAILRLRLMPYMGTAGIKGIVNRDDQRETAGALVPSGETSMTLETILEGGIKFTMGDKDTVMTPIHEFFSFHTHPIGLYVENGVMVGTPSGQDVQTFVNGALYGTSKAHFVVTIEGLYCLSLDKAVIYRQPQIEGLVNSIPAAFEYPFSARAFDWAAYGRTDLNRHEVSDIVSQYLEWVRGVSAQFGGLLEVRFVSWGRLTPSTKWTILSRPTQSTCFIDKRDLSQALEWSIDERDI